MRYYSIRTSTVVILLFSLVFIHFTTSQRYTPAVVHANKSTSDTIKDPNKKRRQKRIRNCLRCFRKLSRKRQVCREVADDCEQVDLTRDQNAPTRFLSITTSSISSHSSFSTPSIKQSQQHSINASDYYSTKYSQTRTFFRGNKRARRKLKRLLKKINPKQKPDDKSFFCRGFNNRFLLRPKRCKLDIGDDRNVVTDGFSEELIDEINLKDPESKAYVNKTEVVDYFVKAFTSRPVNRSFHTDGNDDNYVDEMSIEERYGSTPLKAAKVWVKTYKSERWKIINQAINTLSSQQRWSDVFSKDRSTFKVHQVNGITYIVYIPFKNVIQEY